MLMIIVHHIWQVICNQDYDPSPLLTGFVFSPAGCLGTGLFFFLSGFGMYSSLTRQSKLTDSYIIIRLVKLIMPFIFCFALFVLAIIVLRRDMFNIELLKDFFTLTLPTNSTWFLKVIVGLYIGVFLVFKLKIQLNIKVLIVTALCLSYFVLAIFLLPDWWHTSILNFPLGMIIAYKYEYYRGGGILIFVFLCLMILMRMLGFPYIVFESLLFSVVAIEAVRFINIRNRLFSFIGTESLCFYLFQMLFLFIGIEIGLSKEWIGYGFFVLVSTYVLSYAYTMLKHRFNTLSTVTY